MPAILLFVIIQGLRDIKLTHIFELNFMLQFHHVFLFSLLTVSAFSSNISCAQNISENTLDSNEEKIVQQVKIDIPLALQEIEQAVNINSGSMNFAGVKQVGQLANKQLSALGFDVKWLDGSTFNRAGHIVATHKSVQPHAVKILMIGHLDTVFAKHDTFQSFKRISDTVASGPGVADMKGGNTIIISALRALKALGLLDNVSIQVVLTGDEESSGRPLSLSKKAIVDGAIWADIALGFENGDNNIETGMAARRGYVGWSLNVAGKAAHSSQIFSQEVGDGAIYEAARILAAFRQQLVNEKGLTFNPGLIVGGTKVEIDGTKSTGSAFGKSNVIAQQVMVKGDLRALSSAQAVRAQTIMQAVVSENLNQTSAELTFEEGYPPMALTKGNKQLLSLYSQVSQDLGYNVIGIANPRNAGAADISFAANHVVMSLDGLGLMGSGAHTKSETADLTSLSKNIEKTAILIYRLANKAIAIQ